MNIIVLYHANCADGFGAAYAAWTVLGDTAEYRPVMYNTTPQLDDLVDKHVLIVDFSYDRETLLRISKIADSVLVIDHHASAIAELCSDKSLFRGAAVSWTRHWGLVSRGDAQYSKPYMGEGVHLILNDARSGAWLTWDFFHPTDPMVGGDDGLKFDTSIPKMIQHIDDHDRWQFKLSHTREIVAALMSHPYDFDTWRNFEEDLEVSASHAIDEGTAILRAHDRVVEQLSAEVRMMIIAGYDVPVANAPYMYASDVAGALAQNYPFAATYHDTPAGRVFSLRRRTGDLDLSLVAKHYGGGGHPAAAGFTRQHGWAGDVIDAIRAYAPHPQ